MQKSTQYFVILVLLTFVLIGCNKDKAVDDYLVWKSAELDDDLPIYGLLDPFIYKDLVIQKVKGRGKIIAFDKMTGEEVWRWTDAFDTHGNDGFGIGHYIKDNILVTGYFQNTFGINLDTGETIWEENVPIYSTPFIRGLGDKIVKYDFIQNEKYFIRLGDVNTGEFETIYEWENENDGYFMGSTLPLIFEWQGVEYVVWSKVKWGNPTGITQTLQFLHLFNLDENILEWVSDTIPLHSGAASGYAGLRPKFYDGQILLENDAIYSYNIEDGSLQWMNTYHGRYDTSRLTMADGKIFANNDNNDYMIALDVHTGYEYWRSGPTANNPSLIHYHNEKIFLAGGLAPGVVRKLFIIDSNTGEKLIEHQLEDSDDLIGEFDNVVGVDPETGLVYTGDHAHLLCFDFDLD